MNVKKKARRVMSGLLTAVTVLSTVLSPAVAYASDDAGSVKKIPYYEEIKDQLDEDEVVTAKDYEIKVGDNFDVKSDYTGLTIQDDSKVKVTFQEAKDTDGNDFSTDYANSYKAVYYVEPQTTNHPTYQINRKIVVKEADQQKDSQSESSSDQDAGSSDETETEDSEADSSTEEIGAAETESKTELTEKEFDAEIEATENQETVDPETGITLSEVMQEAVDQEVALADLEAGESITFDMPMMLASGETGTKSVTVTAGSWYYYADYGLGSYLTCPYYVKWGSINATAYCVEPSKKGPGNGTYTIQKLADGKTLAKVCYYGTKASDENGFFDEKHPDFPAGKRFIITHLAAAYANGSSDWASGTNATGKNLAMELYNYCVNMPDIPSVDMSFSESNVKAYVEGNSQRTSVITFKADKLQTITFKLPKGVKLVNVTTGKTSAAGANVEISGGTKFYLTAPLNQAENVSATFSSKMKGSIDKEYSAYKITTGSGTQDLALVFGEGVGNEKYVDFKVTWTKECKVSIVKKDQDTSTKKILYVTLTNGSFDAVARANLNAEQLIIYNALNTTYGNRNYLWDVNNVTSGSGGNGMSYEIPPEALQDEEFARMIREAEKYLGVPYVWGGYSPSGFDCSGFVSYVINHCGNGWNYGRLTADGLRGVCTYVSPQEAKPGDLIFFQGTYNTSGASHVGIYVGNNMMIHCGDPIHYSSISTSYWQQHFMCFGRLP